VWSPEAVTDVVEIGKERLSSQATDVLSEDRSRAYAAGHVDERGPEVPSVLITSMDTPNTERLAGGASSE
jgi:hypothetical protein